MSLDWFTVGMKFFVVFLFAVSVFLISLSVSGLEYFLACIIMFLDVILACVVVFWEDELYDE